MRPQSEVIEEFRQYLADSYAADNPDRVGPYLGDRNGRCANGHPVNGYGRCEPLNTRGECLP